MLMFAVVVVAIFVLWHFLPQRQSQAPQPSPIYRNDLRVTAHEEQWQAFVEEHCESPAETAFLRAMITAFDMNPHYGSLIADGVRLDFQVEEGRYRVDFLVNDWLVVEIDGAAYHSSLAAVARDQQRDRFFESLGYTVLRIPARQVFNQPTVAVEQVQKALNVGKREVTLSAAALETNGFTRLGKSLSSFTQALHEVNERSERSHATKIALAPIERAMALEKELIDQTISGARAQIERDEWLREDPQRREIFEQGLADLKAVGLDLGRPITVDFVEFLPPIFTGKPDIDTGIDIKFQKLSEERRILHQSAKRTLSGEPQLRSYVQEMLTSIGWKELWERIR